MQARIADPRHKLPKTYWVQVEGAPSPEARWAVGRGRWATSPHGAWRRATVKESGFANERSWP